MINEKPIRIALVVDQDNWAFANICRQFTPYLKGKYEFTVIPLSYVKEGIISILIMTKDYDVTHFFWRGLLTEIDLDTTRTRLHQLGCTFEEFKKKYLDNRILTMSVYDHLYSDKSDIDFIESYLQYLKEYTTSSSKLFDIYHKLPISKFPMMTITDGIDLNRFKPNHLERFDNIEDRNIVIGWVGNSAWAGVKEDAKGVNTILKPAIEELIKEGYPLEMYFADRQERMIPHDKMVDYYSKIDLYICSSKTEGTPNPVLESMACGVPIISTDVGIVRDAFGKKQKDYILKERSIECLKEAIIKLLKDKKQFKELSKENLKQIKEWTWENKAKDFDVFFQKVLEEVKDEKDEHK